MPGGRPTVMTESVLAKLEEAFSNGATDLEACFLAEVSKDSLYNYQKEHPEFIERKEALKSMIKYQAKRVVSKAIKEGDKTQSNWYLDRKGKDEGFSTRSETDITSKGEQVGVLLTLEQRQRLAQEELNK